MNQEPDKHSDNVGGDQLPDDLDVTKYVGPYQFPTPRRRRNAAVCIFLISLFSLVTGIFSNNTTLILSGIFFVAVSLYFYFSAWPLNVDDLSALTIAAKQAPYSVGHASAQLSFMGWMSKPLWRVVVFSSEEPPSQRGMVEINAVNKEVVSTYFEENEDLANA